MTRIIQAIRRYLPRRRRRQWKYVSPRRRGIGITVLALVLAMLYGYWHLTNDRRIRRQAESYLTGLIGGQVKIRKAHFRLFGPIELEGVRVYIPGDNSPDPFFQARKVMLSHRPWSLFWSRRLYPTEVICEGPAVTLTYRWQEGKYHTTQVLSLTEGRRQWTLKGWQIDLPPIRLRDGLLRIVNIHPDLPPMVTEQPLNMSMIPQGPQVYKVAFEEERTGGQAVIPGSLRVNLETGQISDLEGSAPILRLVRFLPPKHRDWLLRHGIKGKMAYRGSASLAAGEGVIEAELMDVSLKLPPEEGGLDFVLVSGRLAFDEKGVSLLKISGRIPQAGDAAFEMSGRYEGYESDSPFNIHLKITGMTLPDGSETAGGLARILKNLHSWYRPSGRMDLDAKLDRTGTGEVQFSGTVRPRGMSATSADFPYRLDDLTGVIEFASDRAVLRKLSARRGETRVQVDGEVDLTGGGFYDIHVSARDVPLDKHLFEALPSEYKDVFRTIGPSGKAGATVRVSRAGNGEPQHVKVELDCDGSAGFMYRDFPYPLKNVVGKVFVEDDNVTIPGLEGKGRGGDATARCRIRGTIEHLSTPSPEVNVIVEARDLPLDGAIAAALPPHARPAFLSLNLGGSAKTVKARLTQSGGGPLSHDVRVTLAAASLKPDAFGYEITDASGALRIRNDRIAFDEIRGRHKETPVTVAGKVSFSEKGFFPDLRVTATGVALDKELYDAIPSGAQEVWRALSLSGAADVDVAVRYDEPEGLDYRLKFLARDVQITYRDFPYTFRGITGRVFVTPGKVVLDEIASVMGETKTSLSGTILFGEKASTADLTVKASGLVVDDKLLAAMPEELSLLMRRFRTGGTCDVDFGSLHIERRAAAAQTRPTTAATQPATDAWTTNWRAKGSVALNGAVIDIGFGAKTLSGKISGQARKTDDGAAVDAEITLSSIDVGKQTITDVRGRVVKSASGALVRIDNLLGKVHGGRAAGWVDVWLSDPVKFRTEIVLDRVKLEDLFREVAPAAGAGSQVKGLLSGSVRFGSVGDDPAKREGYGELTISDAELYKMPVMLGFLHVIYLSLPRPSGTVFTDGGIIYHLRGERLVLEEIYLSGSAVSILGSGTMNTRTGALDLLFLPRPAGRVPRIAGLAKELLSGIAAELWAIRVTGTIARPMTRSVLLPNVDSAVKTLLTAGKVKD